MKPNVDIPAADAAWETRLDRALARKPVVTVPDSFALRVAQDAMREQTQHRQPRFSIGLAASLAGLALLLLFMTLTAEPWTQPRFSLWSFLNQNLYLAEFLLLLFGLPYFRRLLL